MRNRWWCVGSNQSRVVFCFEVAIILSLIVVGFFLRDSMQHSLTPLAISIALSALGIALGLSCSFLTAQWSKIKNDKRDSH